MSEETAIELWHNDGALMNAFGSLIGNRSTGLGQHGRDKYLDNAISSFVATLDRTEIHSLYRQNKICEKVVNLLPVAATSKNWLEITLGKGRKTIPSKLIKLSEELNFRDHVRESAIAGRLDGDGFIILGIDDGQAPDQPVNEARIRQISWIQSVDRYCLTPLTNSGMPGNPDYYQLSLPHNIMREGLSYGRIHRTRVLRFSGKRLYGRLIEENGHYNDSVLLAFYASFMRYLLALEYSVRMVQDYDTFIYKLKGLGQLILQGKEEDILKRFRAILLSKSALGGIAMDGDGEDGSYVGRNFSGLDSLIDRLKDDTAAAADMPPTKLWGSSQKTALSNSAEGDKFAWADAVEDYQSENLDEPVTEFFRLLMLAQNSPTGGRVPDDWAVKYKSVLRLNLKEQVELRGKQTKEVDLPSIAAGTLSQEEVRQGAWGGSEYSIERVLLSNELPVTPREKQQQQAKQSQPAEPNPQQKQDALRIDDATPAKRIIDFQGFKLGLQYLPFDQRHGRLLPVAYGHVRGTKGADGMAVDCYVGSNLLSEKVYAIAQHINGQFDEEKLMLGFDSSEQAEQIYKQVMPPEFFGGIREMKVSEIAQYRKDAAEVFQVEGEVLSDREFEELANVDRSDINAALNEWRSNAPEKFSTLLDGEMK
ncbi:hypothetical protein NIES2135_26400 [Leptolyngbya boryana NIES-2135]|jgi:phage-related protein (TIGR01555 family)|uniref:Uncharacterized protein n=1 Tax=Leptolyngbya boryana NIES-2135 TaxID=1973484 RepID=A0A1Z4JGD4_LEPBY|nr:MULTISPECIES: anti-CBASS Acb1 family protein [Leptolyngbya]BAY55816.1 hypothetical protein NIES2135_26400 [Leptolyngbya boryana NIES-2135]MBD2368878.1 DUF1073 domain-containing protein [Leptolyngbya sp. FACHB-161]MBD2375254.1 DUF1073 domain-containing protein [Leptolyngbya sp. FACHB-238]MBD2399672.1 DUF1073 domain-containing protein [Leptolyngbya sp. FACHB-239]MBD2405878.1 DUF1073 domain-containing protein [Leptolyngbya sp. FACHB-402]